MLAGLFEEETTSLDGQQPAGSSGLGIPRPSLSRCGTKLCGLSNLGATCYMNALLQTLHYTPELREALFSLSEDELGLKGNGATRVRAIPVQLQALFSRILLLDQNSVGVEGLINSFGWTNNEEMQQHDVQELNRILFDALESSLVGTSGEKFIPHLYHGTSVQQIICQQCGSVSERQEDFLDIAIPLSKRTGLEQALREMYCETELLEGSNQYHCEKCSDLVDAKRCCRLHNLPPIMSFALLRFLYDFEKGERYKDTSRFQFPMVLDMAPYLYETQSDEEGRKEVLYDLFSVVIHSGSTHSGHYIAYIRDVDNLGVWTHPGNEPVSFQTQLSDSTDPLEFHSPLELLQAILKQCGGNGSLNLLCKRMQDQTGVTWNKRFKQQYGPITKFMKNNSDVFVVDQTNHITLKEQSEIVHSIQGPEAGSEISGVEQTLQKEVKEIEEELSLEEGMKDGAIKMEGKDTGVLPDAEDNNKQEKEDVTPLKTKKATKKEDKSPPLPGHCWYEFNDSSVSPILTSSIEKTYQGKQSAYMLFYRLRDLKRPTEALNRPMYGVPERLQEEVLSTNIALETDRKEYDIAINTVTLTLHPSSYYVLANGALQSIMNGLTHQVKIDRRKTILELKEAVTQELNELVQGHEMILHTAKELPAGLHLYDHLAGDDTSSIINQGVSNDSHLFVWDGVQVGGDVVTTTGIEYEPILLHFNYPSSDGMAEISSGFTKLQTLLDLKKFIGKFLNCPAGNVIISQVKRSTRSGDACIVTLPISKDNYTISQLKLENGDQFTAEQNVKKGYKSFAHSVVDKQNKLITFLVENRCMPSTNNEYPLHPVEVAKTEQLSQVKLHILTQLNLTNIEGGGRLRIDDDLNGLGPPLYGNQSVMDAGIDPGCRVVLEPGYSPSSNQISLQCSVLSDKCQNTPTHEVIVNRNSTVQECCSIMVATIGLQSQEWHLRKTNWCGELGEILDDETLTVENLKLKSGDYLIVESGRLPPKGFVKLSVYLHIMDSQKDSKGPVPNLIDRFSGGLKGLLGLVDDVTGDKESEEQDTMETGPQIPLHDQDPACYYPPVPGSICFIGEVEINKESTVHELKEMILTLPVLSGVDISTVSFLRVRELLNGRPGKIFKQSSQILKRLKLVTGGEISCQVLPHEEELSAGIIVFYLQMKHSVERTYSEPMEIIYDTSISTTPHGLRNHIANILDTSPERLVLAKHKYESFQWIRIEDTLNQKTGTGKGKGSRQKTRGGGSHVNIKNSPILLRDGDIVGVKDLQYDPDDKSDFMTPHDEKGHSILLAIQEEKRRRRKAKSGGDIMVGEGEKFKKQRRPEVGIKIFVPDFSQPLSLEEQVTT